MNIKATILLLLIPSFLFSQEKKSFEGVITFDIKYLSHDTSQANEYLGNKAVVFMKKGNYKQEYPHTKRVSKVLYRYLMNEYFTFFNTTDSILVIDCSIAVDSIISITRSDTIRKILNTPCKSITFHYKNRTDTYFYDENLFVNPGYFSGHKYGCYDIYVQQTKSIYLMYISSDAQSDFIMTAKKIRQRKVDDQEFNISK